MSKLFTPTPVKYFCSVLFNTDKFNLQEVINIVSKRIPELEVFHPEFNPLLDYYSNEMGDQLERVILYSHKTFPRELMVELKLWATKVEQESSLDGRRVINIDVGYIAKEQVVLATGKPYSHRIYLSDGIYAELVYFYKDKSFQKVAWTYPDYQSDEKICFFNHIR